jgi:putative peptidoglycan lipid II flippase
MSQMLKSSGALGAATMTSRVLGMVREMVYAQFMGDSWVAGAFILAFQIPNLFRRLLGEGALTAAFVPIFKEKEKNSSAREMWRAANAVVCGLAVAAGAAIVLGVAGISVALLWSGYSAKTHLMLELLRLMFPYLLLVCLTAVFIGILNARGHFFMPAIGAAMLNVVMIASVLWLAPRMGIELHQQIFGLAIGVLLAGVVQAMFQLPSLHREGYRVAWVAPWGDETVQRVVRQMVPGAIGVAAFQINVVLTQSFSYWLDPTIVASFNYAVRLMELPQGVIGLSFATYLLPTLAGLAAEKKYPEFRQAVGQGLGYVFFINLLAAVLLLVLAEPIVRLLFERGKFGAEATQRAAFALACLAPGLVAYSLVNILARAFFALGDTRTPMRVSVFCLAVNLLLAALLVFPFKQGGLGIANTLSATINLALLYHALRRKLKELAPGLWRQQLPGLLVVGVLSGLAAWGASRLWEQCLGHTSLILKIGAVFGPMLLAGAVYLGLGTVFKLGAAAEIRSLARRLLNAK